MTRLEMLKAELAARQGRQQPTTKQPVLVTVEECARTYVRRYREARLQMLIRIADEAK